MVVLKRRPTNEKERYDAYDSVVEVDDRRSYNDSQTETTDTELYTQRKDLISAKPHDEVMPRIKKEVKAIPVAKQSVSSKTKVLLAAYIIIAVVLAAVVIGTGVAITEVGNRNSKIEDQIESVSGAVDAQADTLALVRNDSYMMGEAMQLDMEVIGERIEVTMVPVVAAPMYAKTANGFDKLCDFLSRIFS